MFSRGHKLVARSAGTKMWGGQTWGASTWGRSNRIPYITPDGVQSFFFFKEDQVVLLSKFS